MAKNKNEWCFVHQRTLNSDGLCPLCLEGIIEPDEKPNAHNNQKKTKEGPISVCLGIGLMLGALFLVAFMWWDIKNDSSSKQNSQLTDGQSNTNLLREEFNKALPQAFELIQEKKYTQAVDILEKYREVIKTPPLHLRSITRFRKELVQLKKCFIAMVLLKKVELFTKQDLNSTHSIREEDFDKSVEIAKQIYSNNHIDIEFIDKFIQDDIDFNSEDNKLIFAIYNLLRNKDWIKKCYAHYEKLNKSSFRKFMITEVSLRKSGSPPPSAPKSINYSSEIGEIYDKIISPLNRHEHLLVYCLGNHLCISLGEKTVNNSLYGWSDPMPLRNNYIVHCDTTFLGPWKTWSDGEQLKKTLQQKLDYGIYDKYK